MIAPLVNELINALGYTSGLGVSQEKIRRAI
jgi:hypothetical protein